jgi:hypothetical protein
MKNGFFPYGPQKREVGGSKGIFTSKRWLPLTLKHWMSAPDAFKIFPDCDTLCLLVWGHRSIAVAQHFQTHTFPPCGPEYYDFERETGGVPDGRYAGLCRCESCVPVFEKGAGISAFQKNLCVPVPVMMNMTMRFLRNLRDRIFGSGPYLYRHPARFYYKILDM